MPTRFALLLGRNPSVGDEEVKDQQCYKQAPCPVKINFITPPKWHTFSLTRKNIYVGSRKNAVLGDWLQSSVTNSYYKETPYFG